MPRRPCRTRASRRSSASRASWWRAARLQSIAKPCRFPPSTSERLSSMNLNVSGHHVEVTPAILSYVRAKLERISRHFDHVIDAHVILTVNKIRQKAEVTLHVRGKDLHCESEEQDLYAAIDLMADKLDRQVLKYKDKLYEKKRV